MKNLFFLPYQVKWVGYVLLVPESIIQIKSEALMLAVSINYVLVLAGMLLFYGTWSLMVFYYNTCSVFLFYLLIFYLKKRKSIVK